MICRSPVFRFTTKYSAGEVEANCWARAKARLESMAPGQCLEITLDDPKGASDIPRAAEAEGWQVIEASRQSDRWRIVIAV